MSKEKNIIIPTSTYDPATYRDQEMMRVAINVEELDNEKDVKKKRDRKKWLEK